NTLNGFGRGESEQASTPEHGGECIAAPPRSRSPERARIVDRSGAVSALLQRDHHKYARSAGSAIRHGGSTPRSISDCTAGGKSKCGCRRAFLRGTTQSGRA